MKCTDVCILSDCENYNDDTADEMVDYDATDEESENESSDEEN